MSYFMFFFLFSVALLKYLTCSCLLDESVEMSGIVVKCQELFVCLENSTCFKKQTNQGLYSHQELIFAVATSPKPLYKSVLLFV